MLPILLCALAGAIAGGCIVPVTFKLIDLSRRVQSLLAGFRPGILAAADYAVMFGLPALAGAAVGGLAAWLWPGA